MYRCCALSHTGLKSGTTCSYCVLWQHTLYSITYVYPKVIGMHCSKFWYVIVPGTCNCAIWPCWYVHAGIGVGHAYYFLEDVFPNKPGGFHLLRTPTFMWALSLALAQSQLSCACEHCPVAYVSTVQLCMWALSSCACEHCVCEQCLALAQSYFLLHECHSFGVQLDSIQP